MEDLGRLQYLALLPEHHRIRELALYEVKRHQAVIHLLEAPP